MRDVFTQFSFRNLNESFNEMTIKIKITQSFAYCFAISSLTLLPPPLSRTRLDIILIKLEYFLSSYVI